MNQRINYLLFLLLSMVSISGFATNSDDGDNIYVFTTMSDEPVVYSLDNLDKITFSATGIKFWNNPWSSTEYNYSYFRLISFHEPESTNGVKQITHEGEDVVIFYDSKQDAVCIKSGKPVLRVAIYDMQGQTIVHAKKKAKDHVVSLSSAPRGIYIVKVNTDDGTLLKKIVKK
jgi:hypothetical protein